MKELLKTLAGITKWRGKNMWGVIVEMKMLLPLLVFGSAPTDPWCSCWICLSSENKRQLLCVWYCAVLRCVCSRHPLVPVSAHMLALTCRRPRIMSYKPLLKLDLFTLLLAHSDNTNRMTRPRHDVTKNWVNPKRALFYITTLKIPQ